MSRRVPSGLVRHLVRRPFDGVVLVRSAWYLRRRGWWRTAPFLPLPGESYWAFRMTTAYGDPEAVPTAEEAVDAARWTVRARAGR